ncbi:MAG TPA: energy transducer TonB [Rhizomicrobium sp.]|nr:energy transducer TonB [Rhizomicrobium sp.]
MAASIALQAGFVFAIISGLAATVISKLPEELKVAVEQEKIQPKPPPPPPPQVELPPPPVAPPPEINIETPVTSSPITVSNKPPPPPVQHQAVTTPVSIGRPHTCTNMPYPATAQRLGQEGTTQVTFKIGIDGSVTDPKVTKSSGFDSLDEAALSCVTHWHYTPQKVDGNPVETPSWPANVVWKIPR